VISWASSPFAGEVICGYDRFPTLLCFRHLFPMLNSQVSISRCLDLEHPTSCSTLSFWGRGQELLIWAWVILWLFLGAIVPLSLGGRAASALRLWFDVEWW